jgi:hypothetical protein
METLLQDIRFGLRSMLKTPGFTAIALIALALGIGANTAMFSIVNAVLLRPVPYPEPQRLMKLYTSMPQFKDASVSYPNFLDWQRRSQSFEAMAMYRTDSFTMTGVANPERLRGEMVSSTIFSVLGVQPVLGRASLRPKINVAPRRSSFSPSRSGKRTLARHAPCWAIPSPSITGSTPSSASYQAMTSPFAVSPSSFRLASGPSRSSGTAAWAWARVSSPA